MKSRIQFTLLITLFGLMGSLAQAGFTSIHVFGDSLSATAGTPAPAQYFYGQRYTNGRTWVEMLAQMQGLPFDPANNPHAYFDNTSGNLYAETVAYKPPTDASNALVVIWVNNADFYDPVVNFDAPGKGAWVNLINNATDNHYKAIANLYAKGIRTLVMPNVVDIATVPFANTDSTKTNYIHQQCVAYNVAFSNMLNRARAAYPDLVIYSPDYYSLLADMQTHPINYGVTNALYNYGNGPVTIDAVSYFVSIKKQTLALNGKGNNFIFWDDTDPTAMVHYIMACAAQQLISPVQIGQILTSDSSNRLDVVNMPLGATCMVESCSNLLAKSWVTNTTFTGIGSQQSVFVSKINPTTTIVQSQVKPKISGLPDGNPGILLDFRLYRLEVPYNWIWP